MLLVEDSEDDAFFFRRMFQKCGENCDLTHLTDGQAAIDFLDKAVQGRFGAPLPQLVFLDLKMPILNGFDVLTWLQKQTLPQPLRVVVLSGSDDERDRKRAQQLGASDYVVKPIALDDLRRRISELEK